MPERDGSGDALVAWLSCIAADVPADDRWLSRRERDKLSELRFPRRAADWRLGRWTAKRAVGALAGFESPDRIEILAAESGRPEVFLDGEPSSWSISLAHRAGRALCALARRPVVVGCDIELVEERAPAFVADFFTEDERRAIAEDPSLRATLLWSGKESGLKALGEGLRYDTRSVVVEATFSATQKSWQPMAARHESGVELSGWWKRDEGFVETILALAQVVGLREIRA